MTCRSCGTTIAEKAIVCYKCGTPTADLAPVSRAPVGPARNATRTVAVITVAGIAALAAVLWYGRQADWPLWQLGLASAAIVIVTRLAAIRVSAAARSGRLRPR